MKLKKLVIKASEWCRKTHRRSPTHPIYFAALLTRSGSKCCLGILATECGIPDNILLDSLSPANIRGEDNECVNKWLNPIRENSTAAREAMKINDMLLPDAEKIERLRPIFREKGWDLDWRPNE